MTTGERQLWYYILDAEGRVDRLCSTAHDKLVRVLQCEAREGREAREAGADGFGLSSKLQ